MNDLSYLQSDKFYHIYNRANGSEKLFLEKKNYTFFLSKYQKYISPIADIFAYCLVPNHFHFVLKIKGENELNILLKSKMDNTKSDFRFEKYLSKQFSNLFSAYTQAFNKTYNRKGNLFKHRFRRKEINDPNYYITVNNLCSSKSDET